MRLGKIVRKNIRINELVAIELNDTNDKDIDMKFYPEFSLH
ncbi:hypothetical protein [Chryseobacterium sp. JM1]|nr:hypothetical protein [Chryseobacterium sp. JM1]